MENTTQTLDYCPRCQRYSDNIAIHNCQITLTGLADDAYRNGDHAEVARIVENARTHGIELLGNAYKERS